jgi:nicotinamide phosphoribosyltransferase
MDWINFISRILLTDSYKLGHWRQYPPGTEIIRSYFESRGGEFAWTTFFGLQYILKQYLVGKVFDIADIEEAAEFCRAHFGDPTLFNESGWVRMLDKHGGRLPISISAVPEGTLVNTRNALMTVFNTDPEFPWLTNHLETLLVQVWYPMTVATYSREVKKVILRYLHQTGDPGLIDFKFHDFGFRGASSVETAAIGDAAHLVSFMGTDTIPGILLAKHFYGAEMAGFSIPASEHSTITAWTRAGEGDAMENMLDQHPMGAVACVSDSFDIFKACADIWGTRLKKKIMERAGTLVVRPDSGDPATTDLAVIEILGDKFGTSVNEKGFKVLPPQIRMIQGDGVNLQTIGEILELLKVNGWAADNIAFGCGGALLQKHDRDTQKCAFKCSAATVDGVERPVWKDPVTDPGKVSKRGRLKLVRTMGAHAAVYETRAPWKDGDDVLVEVFRNGELLVDYSFDDVRARAGSSYTI